ncbi:DUF423 domain-containing protein [Catenovulum sediminis]|uniref:DUF423 domain-containing protein n=1 Tax=Catenovulum sediminis TaxID=1740262 RepID=UPI00117D995B|nr:DUF423 domain-containing protein [Catenovulum sediminis]
MSRNLALAIAAFYCALALTLGAFAAHALKSHLSVEALNWIETAVFYQFVHALAILCLSQGKQQTVDKLLAVSIMLFAAGVFCFSGSLYLMAFGVSGLGIMTPIGGILMLAGWLTILYHSFSLAFKQKTN